LIPGHDDGAGLDLPGVTGLIKEGPDVAGLVFGQHLADAVALAFTDRWSLGTVFLLLVRRRSANSSRNSSRV
jgi:hypothetical protein